jgi:hypothetical protein
MHKSIFSSAVAVLAAVGTSTAASAHDASQVRYELRQQGYSNLEFIVDEAPFQVNACRDNERFHLHVDWYGRITERAYIGECRQQWSRAWRRPYRSYDR